MKPRLEWWHFAVLGLLALQAAFYTVPHVRPGKAGLVCWLFGSDRLLWLGVAGMLAVFAFGWSVTHRPFWTGSRLAGFALLGMLALSPLVFRVYPSSHDKSPSRVRFRVPLDGPVTVGWGGATPDVNYHVVAPDQRWAYDLLVTNDGKTHTGDGTKLEDYYCYGMSVVAPADGVVRAVHKDAPDMPVGHLGGTPAGGNQVVLDLAPGQFLFLCHLKPGSIAVKPGDSVVKGQVIGQVGNSGNTSEPHLHVHLQDTPELHFGEAIPLYFHNYRVGGKLVERGIPTGGFRDGKLSGEVIEHIPHDDADPNPAGTPRDEPTC
jgi:murein DD-endopeptidase MepM/ murein hydrolase activator NlpD